MVRDQMWCKSAVMVAAFSLTLVTTPNGAGADEAEEVVFEVSSARVALRLPVVVEDAWAFRDGGTVGVRLKDRDGIVLDVCLDGRMRPQREARKPYHLFVGGRHPTDPRARQLPVGGADEKTILSLLGQAVISPDSPETQAEQRSVIEYRHRIVDKMIQTLQAR